MMEKTYEVCLKKQRVPDLEELLYRLDAEAFGEATRKDDMIRAAAALIPGQLDDILCVLRMEQAAALRAQLAGNAEGVVSLKAANRDPDLARALEVLAAFGLTWREASCWQVRSCVRERLREAADVEIKFADLISDIIQGVLIHVGMLPRDTLMAWLLKWLDGGESAAEAIGDMADRVLRLRYGLKALYAGEEDVWVASDELLMPDELYRRLRKSHIAGLSWPDYRVEDMVFAARQTGVPGEGSLYLPLAKWLCGHGMPLKTCGECIVGLVQLTQNGLGAEVLPRILKMVELRDDGDMAELVDVMNSFHNGIPLWDNKGRSANEMLVMLWQESKKRGRDDGDIPGGPKKRYIDWLGSSSGRSNADEDNSGMPDDA